MVAVLTTMFSTALTVIDGFPRAIERTIANLQSGASDETPSNTTGRIYWVSIAGLAAFTVVVLALFIGNLTTMLDFATIVSFLTAPLLGYLNLRAVTSPQMPAEHRPGRGMVIYDLDRTDSAGWHGHRLSRFALGMKLMARDPRTPPFVTHRRRTIFMLR